MPDWPRENPWRQGNVLTGEAAEKLGLTVPGETDKIAVVISHSCDLAQDKRKEPNIEVIIGQKIPTPDGNCTFGKSPRRLHIPYSLGDSTIYVAFSATDRHVFSKEEFLGVEPSHKYSLHPKYLVILQDWLACRYRRAAFPNAFERHLKENGLDADIKTIVEPLGDTIRAILFNLDDGEGIVHEDPSDPYILDILLLYSTESDPEEARIQTDVAASKISAKFRQKLFSEEKGWCLIELRDCVVISDEALSFKQSTSLPRWPLDYISLRDLG